ncbi:MAG: hypothetical protein JXD19_05045 [Deltaproteobacteria bacterium]|nr:hypothetical protein [Deltaproteobacteria bacterium]
MGIRFIRPRLIARSGEDAMYHVGYTDTGELEVYLVIDGRRTEVTTISSLSDYLNGWDLVLDGEDRDYVPRRSRR